MTNKLNLRNFYSNIRRSISNTDKASWDKSIQNKLLKDETFITADTVLIYVSTKYEVDTLSIINECFKLNKKVGVPKCISSNEMKFYYISSLSELSAGYFGILEPHNSNIVDKFDNSICIVPGLSFDNYNNRLGYGKGFYDRFLSTYKSPSIGLCYLDCLSSNELPTNMFDIKVTKIITN